MNPFSDRDQTKNARSRSKHEVLRSKTRFPNKLFYRGEFTRAVNEFDVKFEFPYRRDGTKGFIIIPAPAPLGDR